MTIREAVRKRYRQWLRRRIPPARQVTLDQRRIFIFPTRYGFFYLIICALLFIGGINYENNLIMGLCFLLVSLFVVSILHTFRNLSGLTLMAGDKRSGFVAESGALEIMVRANDGHFHRAIKLRFPDSVMQEVTVEAGQEAAVWIRIPLPHRGWVKPERLRIQTVYPLGLIRAWSLIDLDHACIAWPAPIASAEVPAGGGDKTEGKVARVTGSEDFHGLRKYHPGDPLRLVDWKAYARSRAVQTKLFADPPEGFRWLEWERLPGVDTEQRLGRLCYWALQLEKQGMHFGLRIPELEIPPSSGLEHRQQVLDALALFGTGSRSASPVPASATLGGN